MKAGRSLEKLIAHVERILGNSDFIEVETSKRLIDIITNRLREHGLVVTVLQGHR